MDKPHPSDNVELDNFASELFALGDSSCEPEPSGPRHLTQSQAAGLNVLANLASLQGQMERGGIKPRNKPLIIGPSGSGKSALVRRLCDIEQLPLLVLNAGSWIVSGAQTTPHSLTLVQRFVSRNERGAVFIDEVDKLCPQDGNAFSTTWSLGCLTELLSLLDADGKLETSGWTKEQVHKLSRDFFLIGAGTWQRITGQSGTEDGSYNTRIAVSSAYRIPEELLYRFNPSLVELRPPKQQDYALAIRRIRAELQLPPLPADEELVKAAEAMRCNVGMRWVEQYLSMLLIQNPSLRQREKARQPIHSDRVEISNRDFEVQSAQLMAMVGDSHELVALFETKLRAQSAVRASRHKKACLTSTNEEALIQTLVRYRKGLNFSTRATKTDQRNYEEILSESGGKLVEQLNQWISMKTGSLCDEGFLKMAVRLAVTTHRILALRTFLITAKIHS